MKSSRVQWITCLLIIDHWIDNHSFNLLKEDHESSSNCLCVAQWSTGLSFRECWEERLSDISWLTWDAFWRKMISKISSGTEKLSHEINDDMYMIFSICVKNSSSIYLCLCFSVSWHLFVRRIISNNCSRPFWACFEFESKYRSRLLM
jgi:hypothetical protein